MLEHHSFPLSYYIRMSLLILLLLLLTGVPLSTPQKCNSKTDCKSKYAPHCSKWGYCQWTDVYGTAGKAQGAGLKPGACRSHLDCNIRAPVCSTERFCTDNGRGMTINRKPKHPVWEPWKPENNKVDTEKRRIAPPAGTTTRMTTTEAASEAGVALRSSICSSPNGLFPHDSDCQLYYQCYGGTPLLRRCQQGMRWSVDRNYCDWRQNVVCEKSTTTTTITTTTTTTTTTASLELLENIYENDVISINQHYLDQENVIRKQRLTVVNTKEGPTKIESSGPATFQSITSQPLPKDPLPSSTKSWEPRQSGFRALPAVPGRPTPYKRPVFNLYDAVPKI